MNKTNFICLIKEILDLFSGQRAAISQFANLLAFDRFSQFSSGVKFKFGGLNFNFIIKKTQNFEIILNGTSGKITDQSSVTSFGFGLGQNCESAIWRNNTGSYGNGLTFTASLARIGIKLYHIIYMAFKIFE